jgi:RecA/RadA recombinase
MPDGVVTRRRTKLLGTAAAVIKARHPTILLYGGAGVGKTRLCVQFPNVYFLDSEGGATQPEYRELLRASGALYLGPDEGAASMDVVLDQVRALATTKHDRKTLVIDSVTKLFQNEVAREAERLADAGKKNEFGADRKPAVGQMRQLVAWLPRLSMNVILTAGEIAEWGNVNGERAQIGVTFDAWTRLEYELDLAINMSRAGPRRLARVRKSRLANFVQNDTFDCTYEEIAGRIGDVIEEAPDPEAFATPQQLAEVSRLLDIVKLDDGTVDKWLAAANVSAWDEMSEARTQKAIEYLRGRIAPSVK